MVCSLLVETNAFLSQGLQCINFPPVPAFSSFSTVFASAQQYCKIPLTPRRFQEAAGRASFFPQPFMYLLKGLPTSESVITCFAPPDQDSGVEHAVRLPSCLNMDTGSATRTQLLESRCHAAGAAQGPRSGHFQPLRPRLSGLSPVLEKSGRRMFMFMLN
jgi:hypothetical protein